MAECIWCSYKPNYFLSQYASCSIMQLIPIIHRVCISSDYKYVLCTAWFCDVYWRLSSLFSSFEHFSFVKIIQNQFSLFVRRQSNVLGACPAVLLWATGPFETHLLALKYSWLKTKRKMQQKLTSFRWPSEKFGTHSTILAIATADSKETSQIVLLRRT
jgi:hypothetical protein